MTTENAQPDIIYQYQRIKNDIKEEIKVGQLRPGDMLPTRDELAARYNTTRSTVDRAFLELRNEGIVESYKGKGTFVVGSATKSKALRIVVLRRPTDLFLARNAGDFFGDLITGIQQICSELALEVHFRIASVDNYPEVLTRSKAHGLLVLRPQIYDLVRLRHLRDLDIPIVAVPASREIFGVPSLSSDNRMGMFQAVSYLRSLGHKDIGLINLQITLPDHLERLQGFLDAMGHHGLVINPKHVCIAPETPDTMYYQIISDWLKKLYSYPTALIASDFLMTLSLLRVLKDQNISVPKHISVISFDDPPAAAHVSPPITTIRQDVVALGKRAVLRLIDLIERKDVPIVEYIPTSLIIRESTVKLNNTHNKVERS